MRVVIEPNAAAAARRAADCIATQIANTVATNGRCVIALSGGQTPIAAYADLAGRHLPWSALDVVQVDERAVPMSDSRRNARLLQEIFLTPGRLPPQQLHLMPVEASDLDQAAKRYEATLARLCGPAQEIDLVQLGLGADGHTASLFPWDQALGEPQRAVVATNEHLGPRRMTLTPATINGARHILWLVTGAAKAAALATLQHPRRPTPTATEMPALGIRTDRATIIADADATQFFSAAATA